MRLEAWLREADDAPATDPVPVPSFDSAPDPAVRPIPAIGSAAYHRASLGRKFWIATSVRVPDALAIQRELQTTIRTPDFDPWAAASLLMRIEALAAKGNPK